MSQRGGVSGAGATAGRRGEATVHTLLDTGPGPGGLVRRLVEVPPGSRFEAAAGPGGELWYVIGGAGRLEPGTGPRAALRPGTALWMPPGVRYRLSAGTRGTLRMDSVSLPEDAEAPDRGGMPGPAAVPGRAGVPRVSRLEDCAVEITGDRRFRVLFGPGRGCEAATQFAGEIPPGRAPLHSHTYDEVVLVLAGEGVLHAGPAGHPLVPGDCIHLPPGQPHCLENTGQGTLRVLGVFHPGGSPAAKTAAPSG